MRKFNKVELEIGSQSKTRQGITEYGPLAFIKIETESDELLDRIVAALEALEV